MNPLIVSAKVWHPCGAECLIQFNGQKPPIESLPAFLAHLRSQGWLTADPKAKAAGGITRTEVASVSRRATIQNGKTIDIIDFYSPAPNLKHKVATLYLDSSARIDGFVKFSGLQPDKIILNPGQAAIQQGTPAAASYILPCKPFIIVTEPNPSYDPVKAEAAKAPNSAPYKTSPSRFVRFEPIDSDGQQQESRQQQSQPERSQQGPANGIIDARSFAKLLADKGLTFQVALQRIDKSRGTMLSKSAKSVGDIPDEILKSFVVWLNSQPNVQARPDANHGGIRF